ncbi:MAG: polyphosphate kinase 1 [Elusimicrobia bacterium]|nr:polyphosphate kinase 1 [Elusimicrobiota bacterium]
MSQVPAETFFDRELSLLEFQARVLAEGMEPANPLLERLKFVGIVSSNMDEFFMNRFPRLEPESAAAGAVGRKARELMTAQWRYFSATLAPELEAADIRRVLPGTQDARQAAHLEGYFQRELLPILTPIALAPEREVPALTNLGLYLVAALAGSGGKGALKYALVEIPASLPRFTALPADTGYRYMLVEDVLRLHAGALFQGYTVAATGLMRPTRAAVLPLDEERDEDFMKMMSEALKARRSNPVVRLEAAAPAAMTAFLRERLDLASAEVYQWDDWIDLKGVSQFALQAGFPALKRPAWEPCPAPDFEKADDVFKLLREKDVLVHHPYESFDCVARFLREAAADPDVLAVKQTLYRAGRRSAIINALEAAAEAGKRVTVLVELKARFDEENNIEWAKRLEAAGASVIYGVAGLKTHAKACLVVRREPDGIRRYVHLGTGNYNERTARLYSDLGLFTSREEFAADISAFFNMITGYSQPADWARIEVAPYGLRRRLLRLIAREAMTSTKSRPGVITAKMNSLVDPELIEALYAASKAGVQVRLNVRGICRLRPGVKDLSENIEVVSVVDMFLEHARVFHFGNRGEDEVYLSSADWMPRNLDRRVELMFPVEDKEHKKELVELLKLYFRDNEKAWRLDPDGSYEKVPGEGKKRFRVQEHLCAKAAERDRLLSKSAPAQLKPRTAPKTA